MKLNGRKIDVWLISIGLGVVLLMASHDKMMNPADFARSIRAYGLIPDILSPIPAILLPWLEFVCGVSLVLGIFRQASLRIAALMFGVFALVVGYALVMGLNIDCGCGLEWTGSTVSTAKFLLNLLFFLLTMLAIKRYPNR